MHTKCEMVFFVVVITLSLMQAGCDTVVVEKGASRVLEQTKNNEHIAVIGSAFLKIVDKDGNTYFCNSGQLAANGQGQLCIEVNNDQLVIDPSVTLPIEHSFDIHKGVLIRPNGTVLTVDTAENLIITVGTLVPYKIPSGTMQKLESNPGIYKNGTATPIQSAFGEDANNFIFQGWR